MPPVSPSHADTTREDDILALVLVFGESISGPAGRVGIPKEVDPTVDGAASSSSSSFFVTTPTPGSDNSNPFDPLAPLSFHDPPSSDGAFATTSWRPRPPHLTPSQDEPSAAFSPAAEPMPLIIANVNAPHPLSPTRNHLSSATSTPLSPSPPPSPRANAHSIPNVETTTGRVWPAIDPEADGSSDRCTATSTPIQSSRFEQSVNCRDRSPSYSTSEHTADNDARSRVFGESHDGRTRRAPDADEEEQEQRVAIEMPENGEQGGGAGYSATPDLRFTDAALAGEELADNGVNKLPSVRSNVVRDKRRVSAAASLASLDAALPTHAFVDSGYDDEQPATKTERDIVLDSAIARPRLVFPTTTTVSSSPTTSSLPIVPQLEPIYSSPTATPTLESPVPLERPKLRTSFTWPGFVPTLQSILQPWPAGQLIPELVPSSPTSIHLGHVTDDEHDDDGRVGRGPADAEGSSTRRRSRSRSQSLRVPDETRRSSSRASSVLTERSTEYDSSFASPSPSVRTPATTPGVAIVSKFIEDDQLSTPHATHATDGTRLMLRRPSWKGKERESAPLDADKKVKVKRGKSALGSSSEYRPRTRTRSRVSQDDLSLLSGSSTVGATAGSGSTSRFSTEREHHHHHHHRSSKSRSSSSSSRPKPPTFITSPLYGRDGPLYPTIPLPPLRSASRRKRSSDGSVGEASTSSVSGYVTASSDTARARGYSVPAGRISRSTSAVSASGQATPRGPHLSPASESSNHALVLLPAPTLSSPHSRSSESSPTTPSLSSLPIDMVASSLGSFAWTNRPTFLSLQQHMSGSATYSSSSSSATPRSSRSSNHRHSPTSLLRVSSGAGPLTSASTVSAPPDFNPGSSSTPVLPYPSTDDSTITGANVMRTNSLSYLGGIISETRDGTNGYFDIVFSSPSEAPALTSSTSSSDPEPLLDSPDGPLTIRQVRMRESTKEAVEKDDEGEDEASSRRAAWKHRRAYSTTNANTNANGWASVWLLKEVEGKREGGRRGGGGGETPISMTFERQVSSISPSSPTTTSTATVSMSPTPSTPSTVVSLSPSITSASVSAPSSVIASTSSTSSSMSSTSSSSPRPYFSPTPHAGSTTSAPTSIQRRTSVFGGVPISHKAEKRSAKYAHKLSSRFVAHAEKEGREWEPQEGKGEDV